MIKMDSFTLFSVSFQCAPLLGKVGKILTWRWKEPPKVDDELDHVTPHSPNKSKVIVQLNIVPTA